MLSFNSLDELQSCKELQSMGRYQHCEVELEGEKVIACTTNEQYEDVIYGGILELLEELDKEYGTNLADVDITADIRDYFLQACESAGVKFVDVFDEY